MDRIELHPVSYSEKQDEWCPQNEEEMIRRSGVKADGSELGLLTFNVWFDEFYQSERTAALLSILESERADIVALQEVTPVVLRALTESPFVQQHYAIASIKKSQVKPYGSLLLSRVPILSASSIALPSTRKRRFILADLAFGQCQLRVAACHLESKKKSAPERAEQLPLVFEELLDAEVAVVIGDFNFCASWEEENILIPDQFLDLWDEANPGMSGHTEDTDVNLMRLDHKRREKHVRFDRILVRAENRTVKAGSARMLGITSISENLPRVFPSDHFGVVANIHLSS